MTQHCPGIHYASRRIFRIGQVEYLRAGCSGDGLHYVDVPDRTCLQRIDKRNTERPEGSHHLTKEDFVHISSFFESPEQGEGFQIEIHAAAGA